MCANKSNIDNLERIIDKHNVNIFYTAPFLFNTSLAIRVLGCLYNDAPEVDLENDVNVYPNPAINQVNIEFPLKKAESVTISILNMMGETVKTICEENPATGMYFKALDISELERGVYFISIESNKIKEIKKIIVQ